MERSSEQSERIANELSNLRQLLDTDVTAVAWKREEDNRWIWCMAVGCADDRYRNLAIRIGRGLEGSVPRIGRPLIIDESNRDSHVKRDDSPFMRVEQLLSAAACPISEATGVNGVLLAGSRSTRTFSPDNLQAMQLSSRRLSQLKNDAKVQKPASPGTPCDIIEVRKGEEASS